MESPKEDNLFENHRFSEEYIQRNREMLHRSVARRIEKIKALPGNDAEFPTHEDIQSAEIESLMQGIAKL